MLRIQEHLRLGKSIEELKEKFAISAKRHPAYNSLVLFKYDQIQSPFGEEIVRECRGIILNEADNWNIVSFPFTKFFNYGEGHAAEIDWASARVLTKEDGSLCVLYVYDGSWNMSTSGSPDGGGPVGDFGFTFKELFWKTFNDCGYKLPPLDCNKCFLFELTSLYNKIVVRHDAPGLTLLGGRDLTSLQEMTLPEASVFLPGVPVVKQFPLASLEEVLKNLDTVPGSEREGFVIVDKNFNRIKIKNEEYVRLHHLKDGLGSKRALIGVVVNNEIDEVISSLPEYTDILLEMKDKFDALVSDVEAEYQKYCEISSQKDFALTIRGIRGQHAMFAFRGKKVESIRAYFQQLQTDSLLDMLEYKP